jgi:hypothetical protein
MTAPRQQPSSDTRNVLAIATTKSFISLVCLNLAGALGYAAVKLKVLQPWQVLGSLLSIWDAHPLLMPLYVA